MRRIIAAVLTLACTVWVGPAFGKTGGVAPHSPTLGCNVCHDYVFSPGIEPMQACMQCHADLDGDGIADPTPLDPAKPSAAEINAWNTTPPPGLNWPPPAVKTHGNGRFDFQIDCTLCHNPTRQDQNTQWGTSYGKYIRGDIQYAAGVSTGNTIMVNGVPKTVSSSGLRFTGPNEFVPVSPGNDNAVLCRTCHTQTNHHRDTTVTSAPAPGGQDHNNGKNCTQCHGHDSGFLPTGGEPAAPHNTAPFLANCDYCHVSQTDFSSPVPDSKCNQCHTESGSLKAQFPADFGSAPNVLTHSAKACVECHDPMFGTTNLKLVRTNIASSVFPGSTVTFTARMGAGSFADGEPYPENICETCHSATNHHQADGTAPGGQNHNDGKDCAQCHPHADAFMPTGGEPVAPHNTEPFLNNCDYCHLGTDFAATVPDSKCNQCHTPAGILKAQFPADFGSAPDVFTHSGKACIECHDPMFGSTNLKLVRTNIASSVIPGSVVTFTTMSGPGSYADGPPHAENICETCHQASPDINHHWYDGNAPADQDVNGNYVGHNDGATCTGCHRHDSQPNAFLPDLTPPPAPHNGFDCSVCHIPDSNGNFVDMVLNAPIANDTCLGCHAFLPLPSGVQTHHSEKYFDPTTGELMSLDCVECHNPMREQINRRNNNNLAFIRPQIRGNDVVFEARTGEYSFAADSLKPADMQTENYVCNTCHSQTNHHQADGTAPGGQSHNDGKDCTQCHTHDEAFQPVGGAAPPPHNAVDCEACHVTPDTYQTNAAIPNSACLTCHAPDSPGFGGIVSSIKVDTHYSDHYTDPTTGQLMSLNCVDCHNPMFVQTNFRGNTNRSFIRDTVRGTPIAFEELTGPYSFAADSMMPADMQTQNYICNTCHTQARHHQNDGTAPGGQSHMDGARCTACHYHLEGFQPPADGGNCLLCHNQSPPDGSLDSRRRQVVEFTPGDGGGDFARASHHVQGSSMLQQVVTPEDCRVCHDMSQHTQFGDGVSVLLNDLDGGMSYTYNGQALTAEPACLSCHDGNHARPFPSDDNNPPNIENGWLASTHKSSGAASCLDCHAQAHGSDFEKILPEASQPSFCYRCHGSGGPGDPIQAEFNKSSRHPVTASNSQVQCLDCHDPHKAAADNKIAGVTGATVDGQSKSSNVYVFELCLKCHTDKQRDFDPFAIQTATGEPNTGYHPVAAPGRNISSALFNQLRQPFGLSTMDDLNSLTMHCTDCHNNSTTGNTRGPVTKSNLRPTDKPSRYSGEPTGPHGSSYSPILRARYDRRLGERDPRLSDFELCWLCHDSSVFTNENSSSTRFEYHEKHVLDEGFGCVHCHYNSHSNVDAQNTHYVGMSGSTSMVNFAPVSWIRASEDGRFNKPAWGRMSGGDGDGNMGCWVDCHKNHDPKDYDRRGTGYVGGPQPDDCIDNDGDGYGVGTSCLGSDCDDTDPTINPGAAEICGNGIDEDCNGANDACPGDCTDADGDGYGVGSGCTGLQDCNDGNPLVNPGATEVCGNGVDDDCSGGDAVCPPTCVDNDQDGYGAGCALGPDCNDNNPLVNPGATEVCGNGIDDDCTGGDAVCQPTCVDNDQDGYGANCVLGADCDDDNAMVNPGATEVCGNGVDEDCNGSDIACQPVCVDGDGDGHDRQSSTCPAGTDCDDNNPLVHPGANETCGNGIDEDCSGSDLSCPVGDTIVISRARWKEDDDDEGDLSVRATSSDGRDADLVAVYGGREYDMRWSWWRQRFSLRLKDVRYYSSVTVRSKSGSTETMSVERDD